MLAIASRHRRSVLAGALVVAVGCGRALPSRDGPAAPGDAGLDGNSDRLESGLPGDGAGDVVAADLAADISADAPVEMPPDAPADRSDGGPVDMNPAPDLGPPEAGHDLVPDREPPEAGLDLASDRNPDVDPNCGTPWDIRHCGTCDHDCTKLPHVNTSIESLSCQNGVCNALLCDLGYAHCSSSTQGDRGCETDLWSDANNCGGCGITCGLNPGSPGVCHKGACVGECPAGRGDCTDEFGCETTLVTPDHCGACGRPACPLANVIAPCTQPGTSSCGDGICAPGYGNCERSNRDCEAAYGSAAGACLPRYQRTSWVPTGLEGVGAVRADGARFIAGGFAGPVDFDVTAGVDMLTAFDGGWPFVTMVKPDGSYGWTRPFPTTRTARVAALAASPDGGVIIGGNFQGTIDLDPPSGTPKFSAAESLFIVKLTGDGDFVGGVVLEVPDNGAFARIGSLAEASDGSIYVGGVFSGVVDFDPGPAAVNRLGNAYVEGSPFLLKLDGDGRFGWVVNWDVDPSSCVFYPGRLALSATGHVWASGSYYGRCDFDPAATFDRRTTGGGYVLALDAAGRYVGTWELGSGVSDLAADDQGAIYAVGGFGGTVDFDPGLAQVLRSATVAPSSFAVKLSASGSFQWVTTLAGLSARAVALGRSGSVLVAGTFGFDGVGGGGVVELLPDQSLGWTVGFGGPYLRVTSLATTANGFFVCGYVYESTDLDPGPGDDTVPGGRPSGNPLVSEYAF